MLKTHAQSISKIRRIFDLGLITACFYMAYWGHLYFRDYEVIVLNQTELFSLLAVTLVIWATVLNLQKIYDSQRYLSLLTITFSLFKATIIGMIFVFASITALKIPFPGRQFWALFAGFSFFVLLLENIILSLTRFYIRKLELNTRFSLIVGTGKESVDLIRNIKSHPAWGLKIKGIIELEFKPSGLNEQLSQFEGYPILGGLNDIKNLVSKDVLDIIFFAVSSEWINTIKPYIAHCIEGGLETKVTTDFFRELPFVRTTMETIENTPLLSFQVTKPTLYQSLVKELFDRLSALLGLIILSPLFLVISVAIKLDTPGPIWFIQKRVGKNGRLFNIIKFRSMILNAEEGRSELSHKNEMSGPVFKLAKDPRVTRIGKFLRKSSLDEIPQLFNVLKGEMSLVGPRPPLPSEVAQYDNWQRRRLSVKPGITCTWQVSGRNDIDFKDWMKMDLDYIDKYSLKKDFSLLAKTMPAVLFQKGAK